MKRLTRYCSLFLCFLLLFVAFSVSASAEGVEVSSYSIYQNQYYMLNGYKNFGHTLTFYPNNNTVEKSEKVSSVIFTSDDIKNLQLGVTYRIEYQNADIILQSGKTYDVNLNNIYYSILVQEWYGASDCYNTYIRKSDNIKLTLHYADGTTEGVSDNVEFIHEKDQPIANLKLNVTPKKDVIKISFNVLTNVNDKITIRNENNAFGVITYNGEFNGDDKYQFSLEVESKEAGLLKGIIEWLKGIKNGISDLFSGITEGFANLGQGIKDLFNSILELPSKLWGLISEGLKSLFVPSEDFIVGFKTDIDTMLEDKLGAVYQVVNILTDSWDSITANDLQNTIEIPQTSINLPDNNKFIFGGVNVQIVPSGFEWLADTIKTLVGIVCTILFVNGLRKKYDEVMGVEQ